MATEPDQIAESVATSDYRPEGWEKVAGDLYEALRSFKPKDFNDIDRWWSFVALPAMERYWAARIDGLEGGTDGRP